MVNSESEMLTWTRRCQSRSQTSRSGTMMGARAIRSMLFGGHPSFGQVFVSFCCHRYLCFSPGWGQQLGHVPAPCKDVQGSFQGRPQHHGGTNRHKNKTKTKLGSKRLEEKQNLTHRLSKFVHTCPILGDVRDVQVQQGADWDQQQESLQWGDDHFFIKVGVVQLLESWQWSTS